MSASKNQNEIKIKHVIDNLSIKKVEKLIEEILGTYVCCRNRVSGWNFDQLAGVKSPSHPDYIKGDAGCEAAYKTAVIKALTKSANGSAGVFRSLVLATFGLEGSDNKLETVSDIEVQIRLGIYDKLRTCLPWKIHQAMAERYGRLLELPLLYPTLKTDLAALPDWNKFTKLQEQKCLTYGDSLDHRRHALYAANMAICLTKMIAKDTENKWLKHLIPKAKRPASALDPFFAFLRKQIPGCYSGAWHGFTPTESIEAFIHPILAGVPPGPKHHRAETASGDSVDAAAAAALAFAVGEEPPPASSVEMHEVARPPGEE